MFFRCANGIFAARIVREASDYTSVQVADLLLSTVIMHFTFDRLTADLIILGVTEETGFAGTRGDVIISSAFGVATTEYQVTRSTTFRLFDR